MLVARNAYSQSISVLRGVLRAVRLRIVWIGLYSFPAPGVRDGDCVLGVRVWRGCGWVCIFAFSLADGSIPHYDVCHNLTFTTVGLRLTGERGARNFALLMGSRACTGEGNSSHRHLIYPEYTHLIYPVKNIHLLYIQNLHILYIQNIEVF